MSSSKFNQEATFGWIHHSEENTLGRKVLEEEHVICAFSHKENPEVIFVFSMSPGRLGVAMWEYSIDGDEMRHINHVSKLDLFALTKIEPGGKFTTCDDDWCRPLGLRLQRSRVQELCEDKVKIVSNNPEFEYETSMAMPSIDDILDKIGEHGLSSLSNTELEILKSAYENKVALKFTEWELLESINKKRDDDQDAA